MVAGRMADHVLESGGDGVVESSIESSLQHGVLYQRRELERNKKKNHSKEAVSAQRVCSERESTE